MIVAALLLLTNHLEILCEWGIVQLAGQRILIP